MKKITLLYDANVLAYKGKDRSRTGIYFTAYNLLKQLSRSDCLDIFLCITKENLRFIKKDRFLSGFSTCRIDLTLSRLKENIAVHKYNISHTSYIYKKGILFLKIFKNYLLIFSFFHLFGKHQKMNENILQSADIFLSPFYKADDEISQYKNIIKFVILYDAIPLLYPEYFSFHKEHWYHKFINSLNNATYYFCISESTRSDFYNLFPNRLDITKMITMPIAAAQNFYPEHDAKKLAVIFSKYGINYKFCAKYLFSFCTFDPRKNLIFVIKCFVIFIKKHKINDLYFYLGGAETSFFFTKLEDAVCDLYEYRDKIIFLGYVDDEDVNILYSNALFFTYISQYEGFGIPPLEAMQAGVPVITSNNSSLPEVVGDAALTIDYDNEEQCIKAFEDLYYNEDLRRSYIQKGLDRASLFSWEKSAKIITNTLFMAMEKND